MATDDSQSKKTRKRKDRRNEKVKEAYASLRFRELPAADPPIPGTPHMLFLKSFVEENSGMQIHQHANGLCIVTAGSALKELPVGFEFQVKETPQGESKKLKKIKHQGPKADQEGFVSPSDTLLKVESKDGTNKNLPCCVLGRVFELNTLLTPDLLWKDPLLKGYIAVIQPDGVFPPLN